MKKQLKTAVLALFATAAMAQTPVFTIGDETGYTDIPDANVTAFENYGGNRYLLFDGFSMREGKLVSLQGFKPDNSYLCDKKIRVPEDPMIISLYVGIANLDNNMCLLKSTFKKDDKKTYIYAHKMDDHGSIADEQKELLSIAAEKALNQGNFKLGTSANRKYAVILSELPFVKETKEKIMVTLVDDKLNTVYSKEFELPYDSRRGPVNQVVVADNGTVHVIKKADIAKMPDLLTVFTVSKDGQTIKENALKLTDPMKYADHIYKLMPNGDLVVGGFYTEDGKVSLGGTKLRGTFIMKVNAAGEQQLMQLTAFDKAQAYIKLRNLLVAGDGKMCMTGESYVESKNSNMGANNEVITTKEYDQGPIQLYFFDDKGNFKKRDEIGKSNKSVDDGGQSGSFYSALIGNRVMVIYNDLQTKHDGKDYKLLIPPALVNVKTPVFVTSDFDGNLGKEFMDTESGVGGKYEVNKTNLLPLTGLQISNNEFFFLGRRGNSGHPVVMKLK